MISWFRPIISDDFLVQIQYLKRGSKSCVPTRGFGCTNRELLGGRSYRKTAIFVLWAEPLLRLLFVPSALTSYACQANTKKPHFYLGQLQDRLVKHDL